MKPTMGSLNPENVNHLNHKKTTSTLGMEMKKKSYTKHMAKLRYRTTWKFIRRKNIHGG